MNVNAMVAIILQWSEGDCVNITAAIARDFPSQPPALINRALVQSNVVRIYQRAAAIVRPPESGRPADFQEFHGRPGPGLIAVPFFKASAKRSSWDCLPNLMIARIIEVGV